jgi:hypothetical protein
MEKDRTDRSEELAFGQRFPNTREIEDFMLISGPVRTSGIAASGKATKGG